MLVELLLEAGFNNIKSYCEDDTHVHYFNHNGYEFEIHNGEPGTDVYFGRSKVYSKDHYEVRYEEVIEAIVHIIESIEQMLDVIPFEIIKSAYDKRLKERDITD